MKLIRKDQDLQKHIIFIVRKILNTTKTRKHRLPLNILIVWFKKIIYQTFNVYALPGPAPCKRGNLGPWSATMARVHPRTVQQHINLPNLGRFRTLAMRAKE